jgi:hypothetical protein
MYYYMNGCKTEFILEKNAIVDNGQIQCTATIRDTSHTNGMSSKKTILYTVEMALVPQGQPSSEWKVVAFKAVPAGGNAAETEAVPQAHSREATRAGATATATEGGTGRPSDVSGTWSGEMSDSTGPGQVTWRLKQAPSAGFSVVYGPVTATLPSGTTAFRGEFSGWLTDGKLNFEIVVAKGRIAGSPNCSAKITSGAVELTSSRISGTYVGSNSCTGDFANGRFTVTKQ